MNRFDILRSGCRDEAGVKTLNSNRGNIYRYLYEQIYN